MLWVPSVFFLKQKAGQISIIHHLVLETVPVPETIIVCLVFLLSLYQTPSAYVITC